MIELEQALNLPLSEVQELIQKDPVTCARYFDYKLNKMITLIQKEDCIFSGSKVIDFVYRIEFQLKGSPHAHGMLWMDNAPIYDRNNSESIKDCIKFIDENICCELNNEFLG